MKNRTHIHMNFFHQHDNDKSIPWMNDILHLLFTQNLLVKISSSIPKLCKSPRVKISREEDSWVAQFATYRRIWQPWIQAVILPVRKVIPQYKLTTACLPHAECRSTERGSQGFIPFLKIYVVFSETIENRTHIHMNFFHQHDLTNQFPEWMTFFMNNPVYLFRSFLTSLSSLSMVSNSLQEERNSLNQIIYVQTVGILLWRVVCSEHRSPLIDNIKIQDYGKKRSEKLKIKFQSGFRWWS